jgi:hypothetical protein
MRLKCEESDDVSLRLCDMVRRHSILYQVNGFCLAIQRLPGYQVCDLRCTVDIYDDINVELL